MEKLMIAQGCARKSSSSFIKQLLARAAATSTPQLKTRMTTIEQLESRMMLSATLTTTPDFILAADGSVTPAATAGPTGMTAAKVRKAYGLDAVSFSGVVGDGSGQTIAIVDAYDAPNIVADLHAFDLAMGLSDPTLTIVKQSGTVADAKGGWGVETNLDVEWAHVVAPKADILLVLAKSASYTDLMAAVDTARNTAGVSAISMSWGSTEFSGDLTYDSHFVTPAGHTPITFFTASGDNGAYDSGGSTKNVGYPSVSQYVVSVGGTRLTTDATGTYTSETGWGNSTSSGSQGGSGGGISVYTAKPTYQSTVTQSATKRTVPDVAWLADPASGASVYSSYDFGASTPWATIGGTSLASPMWAGMMAIINQGRALQGKTTMNGFSETLPALYALPSTDFHDITTGNNGFAAGVGYDLVTGRGTPIANLIANDMANYGNPVNPTPVISSFTISPSSVVTGTSATLSATASEAGGSISGVNFYRDINTNGTYESGTDTLVAAGVLSSGAYTATATTTGFAAGSYKYLAVATDATAQTAVAGATLTVTAVPVPNPVIGSFTLSPTSVVIGASTTLTASNVTDGGSTINAVKFYRDANSNGTFEVASDTLLGTGAQNGTTWTLSTATTGFAAGTYTYFAVASDIAAVSSAASKATLTVTNPVTNNDNFANATVLTGSTISIAGTTVGMTRQTGEPVIANGTGGHSIWYSWTAPAAGTATFTTAGSNFDTLLGVYTGTSVTSLSLKKSNDDVSSSVLTSKVSFKVSKGTTYKIAIDGYAGASGSTVLNITAPAGAATAKAKHAAVTADVTVVPTTFSDTPVAIAAASVANVEVADVATVTAAAGTSTTTPFASSPIAFSSKRHWAESHKASHVSIDDAAVKLIDLDLL